MGWLALCGAVFAMLACAAPGQAATEGESTLTGLRDGTHATGIVAGPGGSLWFVGYRASGEDVLGRVDSEGELSEFPLGPASGLSGAIAAAPDGSFWFTETGAGRLGRVHPGGAIEQLTPPSAASEPGAIVAGPGNTIWFVEEAADRVGRVGAGGGVDEFRLTPGARPTGIAAGPDGALWIAEKGLARIVRMAPSGAITDTFALPDRASLPHAIVLGPDDALWFSDESGPTIGRITTAGAIEEFPVPGDGGTRELALGADGNFWFTTGYAIGSISPAGVAGEPACVTSACDLPVTGLAKGGDGALWFATGNRTLNAGRDGTQVPAVSESGFLGRFSPPPVRVRLGKRATRVDDGLTTIALSCHGGSAEQACRGWLRLTAKSGARRVLLDQHRYRLGPATGRRLPLLLGARGQRTLARGKRLRVEVSASLIDGSGARRNFVLRARGRR
ncbi:MAG: virginiamycin lyase [Solirubrobacterales bacterium]|jgi:virginiamycin B lyase|nr:virginiamycin lyase [Solirubrobacterales bacterium]